MAHFAELDENKIVLRVIVVHDNELLDENGNESELKGINFCVNLLGGTWVQTSYNATIRKHYAGIGYTYNAALNAFVPPKCHDEAELDKQTCTWNCTNESHQITI